jgi:hypothetical protein
MSIHKPVFRLRGVPHSIRKEDVEFTLSESFKLTPESVTVQSLVASPGQPGEKTATGSMSIPPEMLDRSWMNIKCRCSKCYSNISNNQAPVHDEDMVLDFKLEGLTILYSPVAENWEVELVELSFSITYTII